MIFETRSLLKGGTPRAAGYFTESQEIPEYLGYIYSPAQSISHAHSLVCSPAHLFPCKRVGLVEVR